MRGPFAFVAGGAGGGGGGAMPATIVGISPLYGSTAGSTAVTIEVDDSTGATGATVGGVSLTSFAIVDGTHVSGNTGAHAVGASDVIVTNAGGDSSPLAGGYVYCANDPTAWWEGSYGGAPWAPTVSGGSSGNANHNAIALGAHATPSVGTAVDGKTPATFNGTSQALQAEQGESCLGSSGTTNFTILVLAKANASQAASGTWFHDPGMVMDSGGNGGMTFTSSGVQAGLDGPTVATTAIAQATGAWFVAIMRYDAAHLKCLVGSRASEQSSVATAHAGFASALYLGVNYQETQFTKMDRMTDKYWSRTLSDAEVDAEIALLKLKFPSMGLP